jgi:hypothetical protein
LVPAHPALSMIDTTDIDAMNRFMVTPSLDLNRQA